MVLIPSGVGDEIWAALLFVCGVVVFIVVCVVAWWFGKAGSAPFPLFLGIGEMIWWLGVLRSGVA